MYKKAIKNVVKGVALAAIVATCFSGCSQFNKQNGNHLANSEMLSFSDMKETHDLPTESQVKNRLQEFLGENYSEYLLKGETLVRLPCPKGGEPILINVEFETNDKQKEIICLCLEEYNKIFEIINPNYKFEANFNPTEEHLSNPYNIDLRVVDKFLENDHGMARADVPTKDYSSNIDGQESYNNIITLTQDCLNSNQSLMGALKHETNHLLGRGDSYNKENVDNDSIMNGGVKFGSSLYSKHTSLKNLDVAILDAQYRSQDNQFSDDYIKNFIDNYENFSRYSYDDYLASIDFKVFKNLIQEIDIDELIQSIQNSKYDDKVKEELVEILTNSNKLNNNIGHVPGAFGECLKEENNYTYMSWLGDGSVNVSTQKKGSSNFMATMKMHEHNGIIKIGDAYSGTIIFGIDKYAFSYKYQKGYFDGSEVTLSEDFENIYSLTEMEESQYFEYINKLHNQNSINIDR